MTYLELCQMMSRESGISDTGFSSVVGRDADHERIVDWVRRAWLEIQALHSNWKFLWGEFTLNTVASQSDYADSDVTGSPDIAYWDTEHMRAYLQSDGESAEYGLTPLLYRQFMQKFTVGDPDDGPPTYYTILPNDKIRFHPAPDDVYVVSGQYWSKPVELTSDADTPTLPEEFHEIILYRAMIHYAKYEEADAVLRDATSSYNEMLARLKAQELPQISFMTQPLGNDLF